MIEQHSYVEREKMFTLRDYQQESVNLVLAAYQQFREAVQRGQGYQQHQRQLLVLPTGSGKTVVFSEVIRLLRENYRLTALILAHRDELLDQAIDKYLQVVPDAVVGKVSGVVKQYGGEVTVASVQTVSKDKHLKQLIYFNPQLIIVDEAHHVAANGYQKVLAAFPYAFMVFTTATEDRLDNKPIIDKPPLLKRSIIDMVHQRYLCTPRAIAIRTETSLDKVGTAKGDYNEHDLSNAIDTPARNKRIVDGYLEHANGRISIAFCVGVEHAKNLAIAFNEMGIPAAVVTGKTLERKPLYNALRAGIIRVLCTVEVLTEGFDEPAVSCVIMARPTKSRALYVQCIGRGLRPLEGKEDCMILDITDNSFKHQLEAYNLALALGRPLNDGETIEEAEERERQEEEEKIQFARKLKEKRYQDLMVDLLQKHEWMHDPSNGCYTLYMARIQAAFIVCPVTPYGMWDTPATYTVWGKFGGMPYSERMTDEVFPLVEALQFADAKVTRMLARPSVVNFADRSAPWRAKPIAMGSNQVRLAQEKRIPVHEGMTKGDLSDLLEAAFEREDVVSPLVDDP